ncbi:putative uncharacterized protein DDB_G0277255 [Lucilia cuprina]|uniref:putative uncharacterized protein DDB_G0277255 n=1 Tax=Lucilia cuprina TaxID=7375 RepID=UPI001F05DE56|nr:putative uncharacterized protein DDB_G0277255 [Lucilia cuprina]
MRTTYRTNNKTIIISLAGRAAGVLYAGAQATPDVGAGAVLGGDTSQGGFSGSQAYANGKVSSRTRTIVAGNTQKVHEGEQPQLPPQPVTENVNAIQKIRPPKKYYSSETYNFVNSDGNSFNNGIEYEKPAAASIVFTKTINKTTFATPSLHAINDKYNIAPLQTASLNIDASDSNKDNATPLVTTSASTLSPLSSSSTSSSALSATPTINIHSSVSSSHHSLNGDNTSGNIAQGVNSNDATAIIITKLLNRQPNPHYKHRRNHHHTKRINLNRQRQRSKTFVKVVEQQQQQQQPALEHQQHYSSTEELFPIETQHKQQNNPQIYQQQQQPVRRQLIAPPPAPHNVPAPPCDSTKYDCKNVHREVRSDVVQSALQIPIGILQSLQNSLGNFGAAPRNNY